MQLTDELNPVENLEENGLAGVSTKTTLQKKVDQIMNPKTLKPITISSVDEIRKAIKRNLYPATKRQTIQGPDGKPYYDYAALKSANPGMPATVEIYCDVMLIG